MWFLRGITDMLESQFSNPKKKQIESPKNGQCHFLPKLWRKQVAICEI